MTIIKSHECKSCGGLLDIDLDRQMYICPFCGISYDYDYFREDNVEQLASTAISRGEFGAAKDAYEFLLKKDPRDPEAIQGLFLCNKRWRSFDPIVNISKVNIKKDDKALVYALENSLPEHKDFYEKIAELVSILERYKETLKEISKLDGHKTSENKLYNDILLQEEINETLFRDTMERLRDLKTSKGYAVFDILVMMALTFVLGIAYLISLKAFFTVLITILASMAVIAIVYNIRKRKKAKELQASKEPIIKNIERLNSECDSARAENEKLRLEYTKKAKEVVRISHTK